MKKLPIGISTFRDIIEEGYVYIDKTFFVKRLVDNGRYYFLSRPRRFGESLFLDTLKSAFEGKGILKQKNLRFLKFALVAPGFKKTLL
ncbi:MAG: AAA family ATPase [Desulfosarcina sp.]|nr:AAA family ATPase [Desulfobacterales bacterium]